MLSGLFARKPRKPKKDPKVSLNEAITKLRAHQQTLEKRILHLDKRYDALTKEATRLAAQKKRTGALAKLKQRKMVEKQRDSLRGQQSNIEIQILTLEEAAMNSVMMDAMGTARDALQSTVRESDIEDMEQAHDDIADMMDMQEEMSQALTRPLVDFDEDELDAELAMLNELDDDLLPARQSNLRVKPMPQPLAVLPPEDDDEEEVAPAVQVSKREDAELRQLEMDLAMSARTTSSTQLLLVA